MNKWINSQNGVIRGTLLAQRFMGTDKGGRGGIVLNIGSNVASKPYVSVPIYSATKAAIVGFTRAFGVCTADVYIFNWIFLSKYVLIHFWLFLQNQYHVDLTGVKVMGLCPNATDSNLVHDVKKQLLLPQYEEAWRKDTVNSKSQRYIFYSKLHTKSI